MTMAWRAACRALALACAAGTPACAFAATGTVERSADNPSTIPLEDFVRRPGLSGVSFSPDGKRFAALRQTDGRMNLVVGDLASKAVTQVTSFTTYDVDGPQWITNARLIFSLDDGSKGSAEQRGGGLAAVNADGSEPRELSPSQEGCMSRMQLVCRRTVVLRRIAGSDADVIAEANDRDVDSPDVYRLDTKTGRKTLLTAQNPGRVTHWVLDKDDAPRAAISQNGSVQKETFWYRDSATAPWRQVSEATNLAPRVRPVAFDSDGSLFVASNLDSDKYRLFVFDPRTGQPGELVAESAQVDLTPEQTTPIYRAADRRLLGLRIEATKPQLIALEESYARLQAAIDASLPKGSVNAVTVLDDGRAAVFSSSDRDPGTHYLYDPASRSLTEQLRPLDWIDPRRMAVMEPITYTARDGLPIPAYLTLPAGKVPKKLPLVAWIHGGPWARDEWGWNPEVQFLASRGYAVLQPNYRGSEGFGRKHMAASFKQFGQAMQDDITDGVRKLIADGTVDPDRVCIGGASYGGYATMMGLVKEPGLFRCGIDEVGMVDLIWMQQIGYSDFNRFSADLAEAFFSQAVGDLRTDRAMLEQYSPRRHADKIQAPVLIIHGAGDQRVPIAHAEGMRDALRAAGKPYEWRVYADEGHGYVKPANMLDRFQTIERFLKKHIGE